MKKIAALLFMSVSLIGCSDNGGGDVAPRDYSATFSSLPSEVPHPQDNPYSEAKERLGEFLFWDPVLSGGENVACASCHHPDFGWADGREFSIGVDGIGLGPDRYGSKVTPIHSPTIANTAFTGIDVNSDLNTFVAGPYFWDLRADSLEAQSLGPIANEIEMRGENYTEEEIFSVIEERLALYAEYQELFAQAFPESETITMDLVAKALATYQRTINGTNSRFDQFMNGDTTVFTNDEVAGLNTFIDAGCARCHKGPLLSDNLIHHDQPILENRAAVRTPSLRNVAATAPYMHTGERDTLRSAISIYEDRGDLDVNLGDDAFGRVEAFLRTLSTPNEPKRIPDYVPSGLPVGGDL